MARAAAQRARHAQEESLDDQADNVLQEARVVLPGIQALFGFQLIAVFNERFLALPSLAQNTHLAALLLVTLAIALVMAPPMFHRIADQGRLTPRFVAVASRFIAWAMAPLAVGIGLEVGLVTFVICGSLTAAVIVTACAALLFAALWLFYPLIRRPRGAP
jgi:uncharacterized protein DUF6328